MAAMAGGDGGGGVGGWVGVGDGVGGGLTGGREKRSAKSRRWGTRKKDLSDCIMPTIPSAPTANLPSTLDGTFLKHALELRARLADERAGARLRRRRKPRHRGAGHHRHPQAPQVMSPVPQDAHAALALWTLLRSGSAKSTVHRTAVAQAATAVAALQILETFLQTGTPGIRPRLSADWTPQVPEPIADGDGPGGDGPMATARVATGCASPRIRRGGNSSEAPLHDEHPARRATGVAVHSGLVLYLSNESTTGYAGVTRMASAPDMARPYLATFEAALCPRAPSSDGSPPQLRRRWPCAPHQEPR